MTGYITIDTANRFEHMIDVTYADMAELIRAAYALSAPQGLGHIHYRAGELDDETVQTILQGMTNPTTGPTPIEMDYVRGRSVKMTVFRGEFLRADYGAEDGHLYVPARWYDHTDGQMQSLLDRIGVAVKVADLPKRRHG